MAFTVKPLKFSQTGGPGYSGNYPSDELVPIALKKDCAVEVLNSLVIIANVAPRGKKAGKGGAAGYSLGDKPPVPGKPGTPPGKPGKPLGGGKGKGGDKSQPTRRSNPKKVGD